jgi:hypothetical protein
MGLYDCPFRIGYLIEGFRMKIVPNLQPQVSDMTCVQDCCTKKTASIAKLVNCSKSKSFSLQR